MNKKEAMNQIKKLEEEINNLKEIISKPEVKRERVSKNRVYYFMADYGDIEACVENNSNVDQFRFDSFNYFVCEEEAEKRSDIIEIENKICKLIEEINQEDECPEDFPNWNDFNQDKYYLYYKDNRLDWTFVNILKDKDNRLDCTFVNILKDKFNKFYCYRTFIEDAIEEIGEEDLKFYFQNV